MYGVYLCKAARRCFLGERAWSNYRSLELIEDCTSCFTWIHYLALFAPSASRRGKFVQRTCPRREKLAPPHHCCTCLKRKIPPGDWLRCYLFSRSKRPLQYDGDICLFGRGGGGNTWLHREARARKRGGRGVGGARPDLSFGDREDDIVCVYRKVNYPAQCGTNYPPRATLPARTINAGAVLTQESVP